MPRPDTTINKKNTSLEKMEIQFGHKYLNTLQEVEGPGLTCSPLFDYNLIVSRHVIVTLTLPVITTSDHGI